MIRVYQLLFAFIDRFKGMFPDKTFRYHTHTKAVQCNRHNNDTVVAILDVHTLKCIGKFEVNWIGIICNFFQI